MAFVLGIAGFSGSGKTTLIEKLVPLLREGGRRVAVIKHDAHGHYKEAEGTDTSRYFAAGADGIMAVSPQSCVKIERRETTLREAIDGWAQYDIVLVEGFKDEPHPKVAVIREPGHGAILDRLSEPPVAIAAAIPVDSADIPVFDVNDAAGIASWVVRIMEPLP